MSAATRQHANESGPRTGLIRAPPSRPKPQRNALAVRTLAVANVSLQSERCRNRRIFVRRTVATCLHILYSEHATVGVDTYHEIHDCTPLLPRSLERKTRANHLLPGSHVLKHWWPEGDRARRSLRPRPRSRPRPEFPSPSASAVAPSGLHSGMIRVPRHVQAVTMSASSCAPSREVLRRSPIRLGWITVRLNDHADPSRHHLDRGEGAQIEVVARVCRAHSVCPIRDRDSVTQETRDGCAFGVDIWTQINI